MIMVHRLTGRYSSLRIPLCYAWAILLATVRSRSSRSLLAWNAASRQACIPELERISSESDNARMRSPVVRFWRPVVPAEALLAMRTVSDNSNSR